jgi:glutathione S-transferase
MTPRLHPADPLRRADHRAWIEYGSTILNDLSGFYRTADQQTFAEKRALLTQRFARLEQRLVADPWFDGERFSLVDAVFGPVFRYFDLFDQISDFGILQGKPKIERWRSALAERPSVRKAVSVDYPQRLNAFIRSLNSHLAKMMPAPSTAA